MAKYRVVKRPNVDRNGQSKPYFSVQKKTWLGWFEVCWEFNEEKAINRIYEHAINKNKYEVVYEVEV